MDYIQSTDLHSPKSANTVLENNMNSNITCRICFEIGSNLYPIISPCKCSGTMKYIHEQCLKTWILSQNLDLKSAICDICKSPLKIDFKLRRVCSLQNFESECLKIFMFPFVISVILVILGVVLLYLINGLISGNLSISEKVYLSFVLMLCIVMVVSLLYALVNSIILGCCRKKLVSWRILPLNDQNETIDITNQNEICKIDNSIQPTLHRDSFDEVRALQPGSPSQVFNRINDLTSRNRSMRIIPDILVTDLNDRAISK